MLKYFSPRNKWRWAGILTLTLSIGGGIAWTQRVNLLAWYYVHGLTMATDQDRAIWIDRLATLDRAAVAPLLELLQRDRAQGCAVTKVALDQLIQGWGASDPRSREIIERLGESFGRLSRPGQQTALECTNLWLQRAMPESPV